MAVPERGRRPLNSRNRVAAERAPHDSEPEAGGGGSPPDWDVTRTRVEVEQALPAPLQACREGGGVGPERGGLTDWRPGPAERVRLIRG
eukprot:scaffold1034_cov418-Prasinococcus_capsulatus_cf.AAC.37